MLLGKGDGHLDPRTAARYPVPDGATAANPTGRRAPGDCLGRARLLRGGGTDGRRGTASGALASSEAEEDRASATDAG
jgi:hypothetical protein